METLSRGFKINYIKRGSGAPLVMIPGLLMSANRWVEIGYVAAFVNRYQIVAVDPLGHGGSDRPHDAEAYQFDECARDILAVLDAEGITAAHIWGYSRGGRLASVLAAAAPERVSSLTVGGAMVQRVPESPPVADWMRRQAGALRRGDWDGFRKQFGVPVEPGTRSIFEQRSDPVAMAAAIEGDLLPSPQTDLTGLAVPILVYAGSLEPLLAMWRSSAEAVSATFEVIEGAGHAGAFQGIDLVAPLVRSHLERAG